ncbi:hypothetical protein C0992_006362 [Termitomyces sp. T32_za158]|nr:hypothetical protein C0992_006362 [Termitomyces sp. T32_za158]
MVPIISRPLSRNKSSKIRLPLTDAKKTVISALETLGSVQQTLDRQMHDTLFDDCRKIDTIINGLLKASNEDMNILTKTRRYRKMVKQARNTHDACLQLAFRVQEASLSAQIKENNRPANVRARDEEATIALVQRKVRLHGAMRDYQELFGPGMQ